MNADIVKKLVQEKYNIDIVEMEKIKNVFKIFDGYNNYCVKIVKYKLKHFLFILGIMNHIYKSEIDSIPRIIAAKDGMQFFQAENNFAYLTPWIDARESSYDNPIDIKNAAQALAKFHLASRGFSIDKTMEPRVGWFKWLEIFTIRKREIIDFGRIINSKPVKSEFDKLYSEHIEEELLKCDRSIKHLIESNYYMNMMDQVKERGFCHHDFAHHNVLIDSNGKVIIIDFDYVILDSHLHDLTSLLIRKMKNGKWDLKNASEILDFYNSVKPVCCSDIPIMASFMEFPQDYWQLGVQYYWECKNWSQDVFIKKLCKIYEDNSDKQDFISEFSIFKYNNS